MGAAPAVAWTPLADVSESEDAFHIGIELPGVKSRDIDVEANGPELVVTGEIRERERKGVLRRSTRRVGAFEYRLRLPGELDTHKIKAEMQDGLRRERRGSGHPAGNAAGPARLDTPHGGGDALRGSSPLVVLPAGLADLIRGVRGSELGRSDGERGPENCRPRRPPPGVGARRHRRAPERAAPCTCRGWPAPWHGKSYVRHGRTTPRRRDQQTTHALRSGRFRRALRKSVRESRAKGLANGSYAPADGPGRPDGGASGDPHDQR